MDPDALKKSEFWRKKVHTAVSARDINGDGFISRSDFDLIVQCYKDAGCSEEHVDKLNTAYEKLYKAWGIEDYEAKLTIEKFEEMAIANVESMYANARERLLTNFKLVDVNDDGEISFSEWKLHNQAFGISAEDAKNSFAAMDLNGDGKISLQEFVDYHLEFFYSTEDKLKSSILFGPLK